MAEGLLLLTLGMVGTVVISLCGRGHRVSGPSWFDILAYTPRPTNRAARRGRP